MSTEKKKSKNPTIPEKIAKLQDLTTWFDSDDFQLDQAATKYKEALKLTDEIDQDLAKLQNEITLIDQDFAAD